MALIKRLIPLIVAGLGVGWVIYQFNIWTGSSGSSSAWYWRETLGAFLAVVGLNGYYREAAHVIERWLFMVSVRVDEKGVASFNSRRKKRLIKNIRSHRLDLIDIKSSRYEKHVVEIVDSGRDPLTVDFPGSHEYKSVLRALSDLSARLDRLVIGQDRKKLSDEQVVSVFISIIELGHNERKCVEELLYATNVDMINPWKGRSTNSLFYWFSFSVGFVDASSCFPATMKGRSYIQFLELPDTVLLESTLPSLFLSAGLLEDEIRLLGGDMSPFIESYYDYNNWHITKDSPDLNTKALVLNPLPDEEAKMDELSQFFGNSEVRSGSSILLENLKQSECIDITYREAAS